jgi:hypothetical protein
MIFRVENQGKNDFFEQKQQTKQRTNAEGHLMPVMLSLLS